jgi:hypothetical protein
MQYTRVATALKSYKGGRAGEVQATRYSSKLRQAAMLGRANGLETACLPFFATRSVIHIYLQCSSSTWHENATLMRELVIEAKNSREDSLQPSELKQIKNLLQNNSAEKNAEGDKDIDALGGFSEK